MEDLESFFRNDSLRIRNSISYLNINNIVNLMEFVVNYERLIQNAGRALRADYEHIYNLIPDEYKNLDYIPVKNNLLPFNYDNGESLYDSIYMVISDYATSMETNGNKSRIRDAKILRMYYGIDSEIQSKKEIASSFSFDSEERVRQILSTKETKNIRKLFYGEETQNLKIHHELLNKINSAISSSKYKNNFRDLVCENKRHENVKLERILEIFNLELFKIDSQEYLLDKKEAESFGKHYSALKKLFRSEIYPQSIGELQKNVMIELKIDYNNVLIQNILKNCELFIQDKDGNYYLKNPSSKTMVYMALKELGGIESFQNIEKKIKELFPYGNHNESYKNLLFKKELYFNIGKIEVYGIRSFFPLIDDSIDVNTDFFITQILKKTIIPLHKRTIYKELLKLFPERIHFNFNERTVHELLRKYKSYDNGFYSLNDNDFNQFKSFSIPKSPNFRKEVSINLNNKDFITRIIKENNINEDQFEYWVDNKIKKKFNNNELRIVSPEITINNKTYSNTNKSAEEGEKKIVKLQLIERKSEIIRKVKRERNCICEICNLNMKDIYKIPFIEGHHKVPLSKSGKKITNEEDIALLCPNCHTAIHIFMKQYEDINYSELKTKIASYIYPL